MSSKQNVKIDWSGAYSSAAFRLLSVQPLSISTSTILTITGRMCMCN